MATKNIEMQVKNSSGYDVLYPKTLSTNVIIPDNVADQYGIPKNNNNISTLDQLAQKTDGVVGDYKMTMNEMGPEWLYCNGDEVMSDEYPQLANRFLNIGNFSGFTSNAEELLKDSKFMIYDGTRYIICRGGNFYYTENVNNIINATSYIYTNLSEITNVINLDSEERVAGFWYLNNKYIIFTTRYSYIRSEYRIIYNIIYFNNFNSILNKNGIKNKIFESNQCGAQYYYYDNYIYDSQAENPFNGGRMSMIYQNGTYSFVLVETNINSAKGNNGIYIYTSTNLTNFSRTKIYDYDGVNPIRKIKNYLYLNDYYVICGYQIINSINGSSVGCPSYAYSRNLTSGWISKLSFLGLNYRTDRPNELLEASENFQGLQNMCYYNGKYVAAVSYRRQQPSDTAYIYNILRIGYTDDLNNDWVYYDIDDKQIQSLYCYGAMLIKNTLCIPYSYNKYFVNFYYENSGGFYIKYTNNIDNVINNNFNQISMKPFYIVPFSPDAQTKYSDIQLRKLFVVGQIILFAFTYKVAGNSGFLQFYAHIDRFNLPNFSNTEVPLYIKAE